MKTNCVLVALVALLAACSADTSKRMAGSAAMGGALDIPAGPVGIAVGAGVGATAGALVPKEVVEGSSQEQRQ
jgi:hypothetical protein